jgi:hypothetical protein
MSKRESARLSEIKTNSRKTRHTSMILFFKNGFLIHQVDSINVSVKIRTSSFPVNSRLDGPCLKALNYCL